MPSAPRTTIAALPASAGRWIGPAAIAGAGMAMLWWSWGTWPDPLVDFGRELYVPWQLTTGKVLYRDIAHLNGALSPYLNALWFKLFGVGLGTLVIANIAIWGLLTWMLYTLLVEIGTRFSATLACLAFVAVFSFGQLTADIDNYSFICPYSHEMTHGMVLSVAAILCLHQYVKRGRLRYAGAAGFVLGLVFLTKAEIFLAAGLALLAGLGLTAWAERAGRRRAGRLLACFTGAALLPAAGAWALFSLSMPPADALLAALGSCRHALNHEVASLPFYRKVMGLDDPVLNISVTAMVASFYLLFLLPAALVALRVRRRGWVDLGIRVLPFIIVAGVLAGGLPPIFGLLAARPLPLFMLGLAVALTVKFVRQPAESRQSGRAILQITMVLFALTLLFKMLLATRVQHYGFVLAMPAMLLAVVALLDWTPTTLTRLGGCGAVFKIATLVGLMVMVWGHLRVFQGNLSSKLAPVASGTDAFRAAPLRARPLNWAVEQVNRRLALDQTLLVVPEGVMVNYLTRRENPTPYINFMPPELILFDERQMVASFRANPPDYVLIVHKDISQYGYEPAFFGRDYGRRIFTWIESNYRVVSSMGAARLRDARFGMVLMQRTDMRDEKAPTG